MPRAPDKQTLDSLYARFNRRAYVHPDPVELLYGYGDPRDREIAALLASSLAYGRAARIVSAASGLLCAMGASPRDFVMSGNARSDERAFRRFRHRFAGGRDVALLLDGARRAVASCGTLNRCFLAGHDAAADTVIPALCRFASALGAGRSHILADPRRGGACKRLNLFLRWMVRHDEVDPGGWTGVSPRQLVVPLDTHMARIARAFGWTRRRTSDMAMAMEITRALRRYEPHDPVRYDFTLTRFGIRPDLDRATLFGPDPAAAAGSVHAAAGRGASA